MEPPRHLLVRLPNPMGDAVLATPALRGLRRAHPEARITWAGRRAPLAALDGLTDRDAVMPAAGPGGGRWRSLLFCGRMWRRAGVDTVLLLPHSWSSALAARVSQARRRVGSGLGGRGLLLTDTVDLPREDGALAPRSMVRMYLDLTGALGAVDDGGPPRVVATPFDRRRAERRLEGVDRPLLAINPGASFGPSKVYPPARLARAVARVRREHDLVPLVLAGPGEEALAGEVASAIGGEGLSTHRDPPDVGELKALLERATVLLTTDAGPRHLAEALGTPTVVVMGPTDPRWTDHSRARVVRREDLACLGCHRPTCPIDHPCMERLDPEDVAAQVLAALEAPGGGRVPRDGG